MRAVRIGFFGFRLLALLWLAFVLVFSGLQLLGLISSRSTLDATGWVVSLVLIGVESVAAIVKDRVSQSRAELRVELDRWSLLFVLQYLKRQRSEEIAFEDLGVSIWVPTLRSRFKSRLRGADRSVTRLVRRNRFRPDNYPPQSGIDWRGITGTIGKCWRDQRETYHDNYAIARKYRDADINADNYKKIPATVRNGFTREQFTRIVGKYSEILAVPIWHSDPSKNIMIGVLTIDRVYRNDETPFTRKLEDNATRELANAAASGAARTLTGKDS